MSSHPHLPEGIALAELEPSTIVSATSFARWAVPRDTLDELAKSQVTTHEGRASLAAARKIHNTFTPSGSLSIHALTTHSHIGAAAFAAPATPSIIVADMNFKTSPLPGTVVHFPPTGPNSLVQNAKWASENTTVVRDFYKQVLNRNSIDGHGMKLLSSIRFGVNFMNAYWNGEQMVYGCPDASQAMHDFAKVLDITGHEMTHGVVQHTVGFLYYGQAGALNEHVADCFGLTISHWKLKKIDWGIGRGIFQDPQKALRNFESPETGSPKQPSHFKDYVKLPFSEDGDNGGVHYNSGIPNHAYYFVCKNLGGDSWDKPIKIWYNSLLPHPEWHLSDDADLGKIVQITDLDGFQSVGRFTTFEQWANRTVKVAKLLYDASTSDLVKKAWIAVGVLH